MQLMADRRATDWRQSETLRLAVPVRDADSTNHARQVDDARHTAAFSAPPCRASRACCVGRFMLLTGEELSLNSFPSSLRLRGLRLPTGARIPASGAADKALEMESPARWPGSIGWRRNRPQRAGGVSRARNP
jgi:hypothetical protein